MMDHGNRWEVALADRSEIKVTKHSIRPFKPELALPMLTSCRESGTPASAAESSLRCVSPLITDMYPNFMCDVMCPQRSYSDQ